VLPQPGRVLGQVREAVAPFGCCDLIFVSVLLLFCYFAVMVSGSGALSAWQSFGAGVGRSGSNSATCCDWLCSYCRVVLLLT
jgi:hypothetical protein